MRRSPPKPIRNKLDLTNRIQMRLVRKRLGLSDAQLTAIVGRIGNSLSAISKEVAQQHASALPKPTVETLTAVSASAATSEHTAAELAAMTPAS